LFLVTCMGDGALPPSSQSRCAPFFSANRTRFPGRYGRKENLHRGDCTRTDRVARRLARPPTRSSMWFPHEAILLRWTAAIKAKRDQFCRYIERGQIDRRAPTVIAVNSCRLSQFPEEVGITRWPFAVEAVFPIGPISIPINIETGEAGPSSQSLRFSVVNRNGSQVPTDNFLDPSYAGVSAVLGCATCYAATPPRLIAVHNPLALNPLPPGLLGATVEYIATRVGDEFCLAPQCER
jgi:hypothetical protein